SGPNSSCGTEVERSTVVLPSTRFGCVRTSGDTPTSVTLWQKSQLTPWKLPPDDALKLVFCGLMPTYSGWWQLAHSPLRVGCAASPLWRERKPKKGGFCGSGGGPDGIVRSVPLYRLSTQWVRLVWAMVEVSHCWKTSRWHSRQVWGSRKTCAGSSSAGRGSRAIVRPLSPAACVAQLGGVPSAQPV